MIALLPLLLAADHGPIAPPAASMQPAPVAELEVLSFNLWGLPWPISEDRSERLSAVDELDLDRFDLVAVQEAWRGARDALVPVIRSL